MVRSLYPAHHPNLQNNIFPLSPNLILYRSHPRMYILPSNVTMTKLEYLNPLIDIFIECTSAGLTPFFMTFSVFNVQTHPLHKSTIQISTGKDVPALYDTATTLLIYSNFIRYQFRNYFQTRSKSIFNHSVIG